MSDNHRRYDSIRKGLCQLLAEEPTGERAKELNVMAAMISGIVGSKRTNYGEIASKAPDHTQVESRVKRYSRWVNEAEVGQEVQVMPFATALLANLAGQELVLIMDGSEVGRKCVALMVSVLYRGRALPIAWLVAAGNKGHFPTNCHVHLLSQVATLIPLGAAVILLGDGEFDSVPLQAYLERQHWRYVCRTAKNTLLSKAGRSSAYRELPLRPGQCWSISDVAYTAQCYGPVLAIGWWRKGYADPIYLVSNLSTLEEACRYYRKRFAIETFFSDQKSRGFHLHQSHIALPHRLARLMLTAALAYLWIIFLGVWSIRTGIYWAIHRSDRRDLSFFQLGFRALDFLLNHALSIPVSFTLLDYVL